MQVQIIDSQGRVLYEADIPNNLFHGLCKAEYWEIIYPLDNGPCPPHIKMRLGIDAKSRQDISLSQRQSHGQANPSTSQEAKEKGQETT